MSIGMMHKDFYLPGNPILRHCRQRAMMQAELYSIRSDMIEHVFATGRSNCPLSRIACDSFGSLVPIGDDAVTVYEINPVMKVIDNFLIEILIHCACLLSISWIISASRLRLTGLLIYSFAPAKRLRSRSPGIARAVSVMIGVVLN